MFSYEFGPALIARGSVGAARLVAARPVIFQKKAL